MSREGFSRRRLLRGAAATAGGLAVSGPASALSSPVEDDDFEETEYGHVRRAYDPPEIGDRPVILTVDGYAHGSPTHYVRMRDGQLMAVDIAVDPDDRAWRAPPVSEEYVCVHASIRGTGCSGGTFDLYDRTHAKDGYEIVEWLADRPWAAGRVGLYGYSYSGFTGFFIAAEQPPSLDAASVSLLADDLYRGIVFPGGVPNTVFPAFWALGRRPASDYQSAFEGTVRDEDAICAGNVATREPAHPADEEAVWYTRREDDSHWRSRSLGTYADRIEVPIYIGHAWQDEQTGARGGPELFAKVAPETAAPPGVPDSAPSNHPHVHESPKLLRATNGVHSTGEGVADEDAQAWFDYWLRGRRTGIMDEPTVKLHLNRGSGGHTTTGFADWPAPDTDWTRMHLREGGSLARDAPCADEAAAEYVTGSPRRSWFFEAPEAGRAVAYADGEDVLTYRSSPVAEPRLLAGPATATLHVESTAPAFDLYVGLGVERDGALTPLQRGLLRAGHRRLDTDRTWYNDDGDVIRPYRPHTNPTPPEPGTVRRYDVEVFPAGHLLYPGDRLFVAVTTPPLLDGLAGYEPSRVPGVNTVYQDADRPSNVLLPLHEWGGELPPRPDCGAPAGYRCIDEV
jgi:putative CocE/NonD family hydrolase